MFRLLNFLLAALFLLGVAVQYNDPDPIRWMLMYLAAATSCLLAALGRLRWPLPGAVALIALVWAATLAPHVLGKVGIGELFGGWEMANTRIEEGREMYGLLIIFAWMSVLAVRALRRRRPAA